VPTNAAERKLETSPRLPMQILRHWPIIRGRWRVASLMLLGSLRGWPAVCRQIVNDIPRGEIVTTRAGVRMRVRPDPGFLSLYVFRDYEPRLTRILAQLVAPGDTVLDVGGHVGWYSSVFGRAVGPSGTVLVFEPLFGEEARANLELNGLTAVATVEDCAIGASPGTITIYSFRGLPDAHASAIRLGREDATAHKRAIKTLDTAIELHDVARAALLKVDVEGYERDVFLGSTNLLAGADAPVVHFEVNMRCLTSRGLRPADVYSVLRSAGYDYLWFINSRGRARVVREPDPCTSGDYVCAKANNAHRVKRVVSNRHLQWLGFATTHLVGARSRARNRVRV
jgi:FkbM family methyltransferase